MSRTGVSRLAITLAVVVAGLVVPPPAWSAPAAPEFRYEVTPNAGPYREIPA
jgi:hypothetical protein